MISWTTDSAAVSNPTYPIALITVNIVDSYFVESVLIKGKI